MLPKIIHRTLTIRRYFAWDHAGRNILHTQGAAACIRVQRQPCRTWTRCGDGEQMERIRHKPRILQARAFTAGAGLIMALQRDASFGSHSRRVESIHRSTGKLRNAKKPQTEPNFGRLTMSSHAVAIVWQPQCNGFAARPPKIHSREKAGRGHSLHRRPSTKPQREMKRGRPSDRRQEMQHGSTCSGKATTVRKTKNPSVEPSR